jgi:hypothetical protein
VCHPGNADELLKVAGDELRAVIGDNPWLGCRVFLFGSLQNDLHIGLGHGLPQIPMHDETAVAVQDAA